MSLIQFHLFFFSKEKQFTDYYFVVKEWLKYKFLLFVSEILSWTDWKESCASGMECSLKAFSAIFSSITLLVYLQPSERGAAVCLIFAGMFADTLDKWVQLMWESIEFNKMENTNKKHFQWERNSSVDDFEIGRETQRETRRERRDTRKINQLIPRNVPLHFYYIYHLLV